MKSILAIVLASILLGLLCACGISGTASKRPEGPVLSYTYSYSGMRAFPIRQYEVERDSLGQLQLRFSQDGPDITLYRIPEETLDRIGEIVLQNKLYKLKEHYRPTLEILDGYGWHVHIGYESSSISSGGSNAWPSASLSGGIEAINSLLDSLIQSASPDDIIGHESYLNR